MSSRLVWLPVAAFAAVFGPARPLTAQHADHGSANGAVPADIMLFDNLGPHTRTVTTRSADAQRYFDQGMRLTFAFGMPEARRSFEAAIRHDSTCAMCHWGLAWSLGPYVNGTMDSIGGVRAYEHVQRAQRLARGATDVERALISALAQRYVAIPKVDERARLDTVYVRAMRDVAQRFPDDLDVATLYAEALMVLRPWDYWTAAGARVHDGLEELLPVLERVLDRQLAHPGACHLYIHAVEASADPQRAARCADLLIDGMPGASHMRHMPSHIYMRIGRYGDGVRSNQLAWIADQQAVHGGAVPIYPTHNLHMLLFAASYDGQSAVAIQAARDLARLSANASVYLPQVLVRFGRWSEILELPLPDLPLRQAFLHYARGLAQLRSGQTATAHASLAALDALRAPIENAYQQNILAIARGILAAEIAAADGRVDDALRTLAVARAIEADSLGYNEPEPWLLPVRHVTGAILLDAGRFADAEAEFRAELQTHPDNGWSLFGLAAALRAQHRTAAADEVQQQFVRAWRRADTWLRSSRF